MGQNPIFPTKSRESGVLLPLKSTPNSVRFKVLGLSDVVESPVKDVLDHVEISDTVLAQEIEMHPLVSKHENYYSLVSGESHVPIVIPEKATLLVPAGVELNLVSGAFLHTTGPVVMAGNEEGVIRIFSQDGTGAVSVQSASGRSKFEYVVFDHLGRVDNQGHTLTGGVTLYESDVDFRSCAFINNTQEDALNIIRSNFYLENCLFQNTAFDAFDSDFCTGKIKDCIFKETGNDAIDFSGSEVQIISCQMEDIGDKGISVGEHSNVRVYYAEINGSSIGVASKDLSTLKIDFIDMRNVGTGFTAYQKKAAYGPATIILEDYRVKNVPRLHLIERNSVLQLGENPVL